MLTFSTSKGPVATARGSVTMELLLLQPTLTFNYTRLRSPHPNPLPKGEGIATYFKVCRTLAQSCSTTSAHWLGSSRDGIAPRRRSPAQRWRRTLLRSRFFPTQPPVHQ